MAAQPYSRFEDYPAIPLEERQHSNNARDNFCSVPPSGIRYFTSCLDMWFLWDMFVL
jgi:hypothetical protein